MGSPIKVELQHTEDLPEDSIVTGKFVEIRVDRQDNQSVEYTIFLFRNERLGDVLVRAGENRKYNDKLIIDSITFPK
ncbi:hypothetical protein ACFL08_02495 [Patescibacteria group bacterium]